MRAIEYVLAIIAWTAIAMLIVFLGRIAYFYEKTSGQRVGYYLLLIPSLLLAAGAICYFTRNVEFTGEPTCDLLLSAGGLLLILFGGRLQGLMTGERR